MSAQESEVIRRTAIPVRPAILIVEDEIILAMDLQRTLIDLGYDAYAIASSAEAAPARATATMDNAPTMTQWRNMTFPPGRPA